MFKEVADMTQRTCPGQVRLEVPAGEEYALVAAMTVSGMGVLAGLDVDLIGDLRTMTCECLDCLRHQPSAATRVLLEICLRDGRLWVRFEALQRQRAQQETGLDLDLTRGVLETLMPDVRLHSDAGGVWGIECPMPA